MRKQATRPTSHHQLLFEKKLLEMYISESDRALKMQVITSIKSAIGLCSWLQNIYILQNLCRKGRMDHPLIEAAQQGNIDRLYEIIRENPRILEEIDAEPFVDTPLHLAAAEGHIHFALEIMRLKPSFARKLNQVGQTPLHLALLNVENSAQMVHRLVHVDPSLIRVKGREGITPLHYVAAIGDLVVLTEFLSVCPESIEDLTIRSQTALHIALTNNRVQSFKLLLRWLRRGFYQEVGDLKNKVLNWKDDQGNTLLHIAMLHIVTDDHLLKVVRSLLKNGVNVNATNLGGLTSLDILQRRQGNIEIVVNMLKDARAKTAKGLGVVTTLAGYLNSNTLPFERVVVYLMTGKSNMSSENRSAILVIAVLIVTATYQAGLNPPGGFLQDEKAQPNLISNYGNTTITTNATTIASHSHLVSKPLMDYGHFMLFQSFNFVAFCASLGLIFLLVPNTIVVFPLGYSLIGCYLFSLSALSPPPLAPVLYICVVCPIIFISGLIYRDYAKLSSCYQLIFPVHTEKWPRRPKLHQMKLKTFVSLSVVANVAIIIFMLSHFKLYKSSLHF